MIATIAIAAIVATVAIMWVCYGNQPLLDFCNFIFRSLQDGPAPVYFLLLPPRKDFSFGLIFVYTL